MHPAHLFLAVVLVLTAWQVGASDPSHDLQGDLPDDLIDSCSSDVEAISGADSASASPSFNLYKHCPQLAKWLARSLDSGALGSLKIDAASIEGLRDLQFFSAGMRRPPAPVGRFHPDFDGLDALLSDVLIEEQADDGLWERFLHWLGQYLKDGDSGNLKGLVDWLEGIDAPPWLGDAIVNTSVVLIVLLALMVVGNELRLADVLRRVRRPQATKLAGSAQMAAPKAYAVSFEELRNLPARQLAAGILAVVTAAFADRGWISSSSSLTNGERIRQLAQRQGGIAGAFEGLVRGIEKVIYGDRDADAAARQRLLESARELVTLDAAGGPVAARDR